VNAPALSAGLARADREKRLVALSSVLAAVLLTGMKVAVGASTGSIGILAEAAHSGLDLVAAAVTFWAVRVAGQPADPEHTYGHGKVENLSALFETALLLATCAWIVYESVERLFFHPVHVEPTPWAFAVMATSIVIDVSRSRALARTAKKYGSQALEADALHFSTDVWSSAVVLVGLALVLVSQRTGVAWLAQADAVAALAVAAIVVVLSLKLGKKSIDDLVDAVPEGLRERLVAAARVPGVVDVPRLRVRRTGPAVFVDATLTVGRHLAFERAHAVADAAEAALRALVPGADVVAHVEPVPAGAEGLLATTRLLAARYGLGAHAIRTHGAAGRLSMELHLEVDERLTVGEAHALVTDFEQEVRTASPDLHDVVSHIEPVGEATAARRTEPTDDGAVRAELEALRVERGPSFRPEGLAVRTGQDGLLVTFVLPVPADLPVGEAHALADEVERDLKRRLGGGRVVIHVEPKEERRPPTGTPPSGTARTTG
jgi:cation diffusion facilitator family transporter